MTFGQEIRLSCDLKFGRKPEQDVVGEEYVSNLKKKIVIFMTTLARISRLGSDRIRTVQG